MLFKEFIKGILKNMIRCVLNDNDIKRIIRFLCTCLSEDSELRECFLDVIFTDTEDIE